jgi:hypothetical protein
MKIFIVGRLRQPLSAPSHAEGLTRDVGPGRTRASSQCCQRKDKPRSLSGGARLALWACVEGRIWGVDNVHTLGLGLGRMWVGSGRIRTFPREPSVYKGRNAVRVPPRARFPMSEAFFASDVCTFSLCGSL